MQWFLDYCNERFVVGFHDYRSCIYVLVKFLSETESQAIPSLSVHTSFDT